MLVDVQTAISYPDPTPITPIAFETFSNPSRPLRLKSRIRNWKHWVTPARAAARRRRRRNGERGRTSYNAFFSKL